MRDNVEIFGVFASYRIRDRMEIKPARFIYSKRVIYAVANVRRVVAEHRARDYDEIAIFKLVRISAINASPAGLRKSFQKRLIRARLVVN